MPDALGALEKQLADYVGFRRRYSDAEYALRDAIVDHRRQCVENLRHSEDVLWAEAIRTLDRLAEEHQVPLVNEPNLRWLLDAIAERQRQRRAEVIHRARGGTNGDAAPVSSGGPQPPLVPKEGTDSVQSATEEG